MASCCPPVAPRLYFLVCLLPVPRGHIGGKASGTHLLFGRCDGVLERGRVVAHGYTRCFGLWAVNVGSSKSSRTPGSASNSTGSCEGFGINANYGSQPIRKSSSCFTHRVAQAVLPNTVEPRQPPGLNHHGWIVYYRWLPGQSKVL
jgi:hypothetical protein